MHLNCVRVTIKVVISILAALQLGIIAPSCNGISLKKYSSYVKEQSSKNSNSYIWVTFYVKIAD